MSSLTQIRNAVKTTLEANVTGLKCYARVEVVNAIPTGGCAVVVAPAAIDFLVAMKRGTDTYAFDLMVMVAAADLDLAQQILDGFVTGAGSTSIRQAVFNAKTLGLADCDAHVAGMVEGSYGGRFASAAIDHVGATLGLIVHTTGTA
jgi:hypothetical protein